MIILNDHLQTGKEVGHSWLYTYILMKSFRVPVPQIIFQELQIS